MVYIKDSITFTFSPTFEMKKDRCERWSDSCLFLTRLILNGSKIPESSHYVPPLFSRRFYLLRGMGLVLGAPIVIPLTVIGILLRHLSDSYRKNLSIFKLNMITPLGTQEEDLVKQLRQAAAKEAPEAIHELASKCVRIRKRILCLMQEATTLGHYAASFCMTMHCEQLKDQEGAEKMLLQTIKQAEQETVRNNPKACHFLDGLYSNSAYGSVLYTIRNPEKAFTYATKGAELGDAACMQSLVNCYKHGVGVTADKEKVHHWRQKAAESGSTAAMIALGEKYLKSESGPQQALGLQWLNKAADRQDIAALLKLAERYRYGLDVVENQEQAVSYYERAATLHDANAMKKFAAYLIEEKTEESKKRAFNLYLKAAHLNDQEAIKIVASWYKNGIGTEKDATSAKSWKNKLKKLIEE